MGMLELGITLLDELLDGSLNTISLNRSNNTYEISLLVE